MPLGTEFPSAPPNPIAKMLEHSIGNKKLCVLRPAVEFLGRANFFFAERFTVRGVGVLLLGRAIANMAIHDDQRRAIVGPLKFSDSICHRLQVIGVGNMNNIPAITEKASCSVLAERPDR